MYKFHKRTVIIVSSLFRFLKYFFWIGLFPYLLLCGAVNFDFILILINFDFILCKLNSNFDLYCNTPYYYVLFNRRCMHVLYVQLNST